MNSIQFIEGTLPQFQSEDTDVVTSCQFIVKVNSNCFVVSGLVYCIEPGETVINCSIGKLGADQKAPRCFFAVPELATTSK